MRNILPMINDCYVPFKAFIAFENRKKDDFYIESYDLDDFGRPINAHPLSLMEGNTISASMDSRPESRQSFLCSRGLMPPNLLYLNPKKDGYVVWHTPKLKVQLLFKPNLQLTDGIANVPPMIWKASKSNLSVWAHCSKKPLELMSKLCHAPFFNISADGCVCMGDVDIKIDDNTSLEDFISLWQSYFFGSKFSHSNVAVSPIKSNIIQFWQGHIGSDLPFPLELLTNTGRTLKSIL